MNFRPDRRRDDGVEVNLTSLIDVVFLLLIFFMVTTSFDRYAYLKVQLPEASNKAQQHANAPLVISVDAKGRYYVDQRQVVNTSLETLKEAIQQTIGNRKDVTVLLRADANSTHQSVVRAMDAASQLGLDRISIATVENK